MPSQPSPASADRPVSRDELVAIFHEAEKPPSEFRLGGEAEKFGVQRRTGAPLVYEGPSGVTRIFEYLSLQHGWTPEQEVVGGPVIALRRDEASITLEPGAQLELSGSPFHDVHAVVDEMQQHLSELEPISRELDLQWLGIGFHPTARPSDLPWVPKQRYSVMRAFLPTRGSRAVDMMQRTATVQVNVDYSGEADAMRKLVLLSKLSPLLHVMTANSPFIEGKVSDRVSERGDVWLHMDPSRSGLIPALWEKQNPRYDDYVEWALDAPMFLFRRGDEFIKNTGQTFRSFLADGFEGHRATRADWVSHVNSLFPEARLKRTLEVRACDSLPQELAGAVPALVAGIVYDAGALDQASALVEGWRYEAVEAARPALVQKGLRASIAGKPAAEWCEQLLSIALGGLERRARLDRDGKDERVHLQALAALIESGRTPAQALLEDLGPDPSPAELRDRASIHGR